MGQQKQKAMRLTAAFTAIASLLLLLASAANAEVHLIVGPRSQGGTYPTIQAAVDAVPSNSMERHIIDILPGTYTARVMIPSDKPNVTLRGHGSAAADTVIAFNETANTPPNESTVHATMVVRGRDFIAENLTFANTYGPGVQALAIYARGDRSIFNNVRFTGWQDTLRSESGRHYFYNSYIEGSVDFIYGKGQAFFEKSTLYAKTNGYLTAQGRESPLETNGYVFKDSLITGTARNNSVYLGRPWQAYSRAIFIDTKMGPMIHPAGWATWSGSNHLTSFFAEHNSMDLDGNPIDVSQRVSWSHQLTAEQLAGYSKQAWLSGNDGWNPVAADLLSVSPDFDGSGRIDATDFLIWQRGVSNSGPNLLELGDANGDGTVGRADLTLWQARYGWTESVSLQGLAVPEPSSLAICLFGGMIISRLASSCTTERQVPQI